MAAEPRLERRELAAEHERLASERAAVLEDPSCVAERRLVERIQGRHPYRMHAYGPDRGFPLRRDLVLRFWRRNWRPAGSALVAAGAFDFGRLARLVERAARGWTGDAPPPLRRPPIDRAARHRTLAMPGKTQADVALGRLLPARDDAAFPYLRILDAVLGHIVLMGRLGARLRTESGLAYYAFSRIDALRLASQWSIHMGVGPRHAGRALREAADVLRSLAARGITGRELGLAKVGICSDLLERTQTSGGLCSLLSMIAAADVPVTYVSEFLERVRAAPRTAVNEAAGTYADPAAWSTVVVAPPA
jgi:zinc protease